MNNQWKPNSWKEKPAKHLPTYKDVKSLELITKKLSKSISAQNIEDLKQSGLR